MRGAMVPAQVSADDTAIGDNPDSAARFLISTNPACGDVARAVSALSMATANWQTISPDIPAVNWNAQQRSVNQSAVSAMESFADSITDAGERSDNEKFAYFAKLVAQYRRTFAAALPTYLPADNYLNEVATGIAGAINEACSAVEA